MLLYSELAPWWPLLSAPADYADEAALYTRLLRRTREGECRTLLELGSGGGNNAFHMKRAFDSVTLVDPAPGMLEVSRELNPECEHAEGDMRTLRLDRTFDAVFVHDAVCYMTSMDDLVAAVETAAVHCRAGGAVLFAPDFVRETFRAGTSHGGHDGDDGRALRYLEWTRDDDPDDGVYEVDYTIVLRHADGRTEARHDRHEEGLFARDTWLALLDGADVEARAVAHRHEGADHDSVVFVGRKRP